MQAILLMQTSNESSDVRVHHDDWAHHQHATTQNFVMSQWLYDEHPMIHSLLTFGLDRQVEHHVFPRLKLHRLQDAERELEHSPRKHVLGWRTARDIATSFA